jgi:hypothetical protein
MSIEHVLNSKMISVSLDLTPQQFIWAISKTWSTRSTEHTEYGAVEKRKSSIIKYTVYYYEFLLLLIKIFRILHVGEAVRKLGF